MFKLTLIKNGVVEYEDNFWSYHAALVMGMRYQTMGYTYIIKKKEV